MQTSLVKSILRWRWTQKCSLLELLLLKLSRMAVKCEQMEKWKVWKTREVKNKMAAFYYKTHPHKERKCTSQTKLSSYLLCGPARAPVVSPIPREPVASLSDVCVCACVHVWVSRTCLLKTSIHRPGQLTLSLSYTGRHASPLLLSTLIMWFPSDSQRGVPFGIPDAELHADWPIGSSLMKMRVMIFFFILFHKHHQPP